MDNHEYLNANEKKVMSGLYQLGQSAVGTLAKQTLINRTSLYPILDKLMHKGLVSKLEAEGRVLFQPLSAEEIKDWAKRKKAAAAAAADNLIKWSEAQAKTAGNPLLSEIKYFEGLEGVKTLYADTWRNNQDKMIYALTDYKSAYENMRTFFRGEYFPARVKHEVKVKNLIPESAAGRSDLKEAKQMLREMRFIKMFEDLGIEINIYDNKVALVSFDKKTPAGLIIKNAKIAQAFKNIFSYLWQSVN